MSKKAGILIGIVACIAIIISVVSLILVIPYIKADKQKDTQYVMYLGTNDKDTNLPVFSSEDSKEKAEQVLIEYFGGYTIQEANGGWIDNEMIYTEYTIVIYLSDTTLDKVHAAADKLIEIFNQSSVLIQANDTITEFYSGK